jgi:hypothetical protein
LTGKRVRRRTTAVRTVDVKFALAAKVREHGHLVARTRNALAVIVADAVVIDDGLARRIAISVSGSVTIAVAVSVAVAVAGRITSATVGRATVGTIGILRTAGIKHSAHREDETKDH